MKQYSLEIVAEDPIASGHTVLEYQRLSKAHVALSGGFLKSYYPPLPQGLVKSNGRILNRPNDDPFFSGLFCSRKGELIIEPYTGKEQTTPWDHCLQSGPLLVYEGRSALEVRHYPRQHVYGAFNRAFVAIDQQGRTLLAVTGKATLLPSLMELLQRPAEHGGLECRAALNLSGVSVGMVVDVAGRFLSAGDIEVYPPNAIIAADLPVPNVVMLGIDEAREILLRKGLRLGELKRKTTGRARPGTVLDQNPPPGQRVPHGSIVNVVLEAE